jgi:hypothetical protein
VPPEVVAKEKTNKRSPKAYAFNVGLRCVPILAKLGTIGDAADYPTKQNFMGMGESNYNFWEGTKFAYSHREAKSS